MPDKSKFEVLVTAAAEQLGLYGGVCVAYSQDQVVDFKEAADFENHDREFVDEQPMHGVIIHALHPPQLGCDVFVGVEIYPSLNNPAHHGAVIDALSATVVQLTTHTK